MNLARAIRHLVMPQWRARQVFPKATLSRIERAIAASEARHAGQIRFAVEHALPVGDLLRGRTGRQRALDVFSMLGVWDTEHNNGVLIYLLLADRDVEIVADRGIHGKVGANRWGNICREMEAAFGEGRFEDGVLKGIERVSHYLQSHYPLMQTKQNELPDRPVVL